MLQPPNPVAVFVLEQLSLHWVHAMLLRIHAGIVHEL